jgi:DNA polymerase-1
MPFRHRFGENLEKQYLEQLREVLKFRESQGFPNVYHNLKFDLESLGTIGVVIGGTADYCTMMMSYLLNENIYSQSLNSTSKHWIDDPGKKDSPEFKRWTDKHGWDTIPSPEMYEYASYDADLTLRLFEHLHPKFKAEGLEGYWIGKRQIINIVRAMERRGIKIDVPLSERMAYIGDEQLEDIREILGRNPGSNKDLAHLLLTELGLPIVKVTPTGNPSFDKYAMEEYDEMLERRDNDTAKLIRAYRGWQKAVSSNYKPYVALLSPDGRLRPNYKLHRTKTGRWSCESPNLQQIPKKSLHPWNGEMKKVFIEDPGWTLYEGDYSQLELRLATHYSRDASLMELFADDTRDIFTEMAEKTGLTRNDQKTLVYTIQYGGGIRRIKNVFNVDALTAEQMRAQFFAGYPGFKNASNLASSTAKKNKRIKLWSGRYRHFRFVDEEAHKAFNSACQGGAADIVEGTMRRLYDTVDGSDCKMLLQVHDSVVFAVRDEVAHEVLPEIKRVMEDVQPDFGIRFRVDVHRWGS